MTTSERTKRLFTVALGALLGLLLLEGALRVREAILGPPAAIDVYVSDPHVAFRLNPALPGHDRRGWRNAATLSQANIVALGDSQTHGWLDVSREDAWPQQLGRLLDRSVYQMAVGGYGPAHYVPLLDEALALRPKAILAAYYLGNDIYDSYWLVHKIGERQRSAPDPVLDAFATDDPQLQKAVTHAEQADPKFFKADYINCGRPPLPIADPVRLLHDRIPAPIEVRADTRTSGGPIIGRLLRGSLVLRSAWRSVRTLRPPVEKEPADYGPPLCVRYRDEQMRTVLNVGLRLIALDDTDPRTTEGQRIVFQALRFVADRCRREGIRFYVVLIPSKEAVFRSRAEPALSGQRYLARVWNAEARARDAALRFFTREGIAVIDTLPALEALIASGINPYKNDANGHPIPRGYGEIARAVLARLARDRVPGP